MQELERRECTREEANEREVYWIHHGLLGPPTKYTTLRSVEPLRLRRLCVKEGAS
jgi:hypothetical protein